tara:strand:+ start:2949 stop:3971 length:1023 start_codon:yes stop_codon:yes gene_type:complete
MIDLQPSDKQGISWINLDIRTFHNRDNNSDHAKGVFRDLQENHNIDMLLIGGGGLIENKTSYKNGWKLPFTKEVLSEIKVPIVVFAAGINYFYNFETLSEISKQEVINLCEASSLFSLRNDGSIEIFKTFSDLEVEELPDPGLLFDHDIFKFERKEKVVNGFFQPAWNRNAKQTRGRRLDNKNISKINDFCFKNQLVSFCHTKKDYFFPWNNEKKYVIDKEEFPEICKFTNTWRVAKYYHSYDFSVAMRGHGQLMAIGLNLPSIYLSTQPKVLDFSQKNGFSQYTVDIRKDDWHQQLEEKTKLLKNDKDFLEQWYDIRDRNMVKYRSEINDFCKKIWELL